MNEHPTDAQNLRGASLIIPCFEWNKPSAETLMVKEEILDPCDLHLRLFETLTGNSPPVNAFRACQKSLSAGAAATAPNIFIRTVRRQRQRARITGVSINMGA